MTNPNQQATLNSSFAGARFTLLLAGLLIILGSALQIGELGYGNVRPANLWMFSVIAPNIWNTLAAGLNAPYWQDVWKFWPLILVGAGVAILFLVQHANRYADWIGHQKGRTHV
jgi:hypothetical protein